MRILLKFTSATSEISPVDQLVRFRLMETKREKYIVPSIEETEAIQRLAEINRAAFLESVPVTRVFIDLCVVIAVSLSLYALVIWKVHKSDR